MDHQLFDSPVWRQALTLAERSPIPPDAECDAEAGARRIARWRSQWPFSEGEYLAQRLASDGLDQETLARLLGEAPASLRARLPDTPAWLAELAEAYSRPSSRYASPRPGEEMLGFLDIIQPLIDRACDRLAAGVAHLAERYPALPFDPATIEDILTYNLPDPLLMRLGRVLVLELNVARLQGLLEGDTPATRFQSFVERLRRPEVAVAILAEYPGLARQLVICADMWVNVSLEFLSRLSADWADIRANFCPDEEPGLLTEVIGGAGDTHREGHSVMVLRFASGFRLAYKPKSLAMDVHFPQLLTWLNARGCTPPLHAPIALDRGEYGWVEFIRRATCHSPDEIERFYRRHGAYLALLYAFDATDFHYENVIAAGEHPVLIDLETIFHPKFDALGGPLADMTADQLISDSVMQIGLLPARMWSYGDFAGVDISGLGGAPGQLSPDRVPQVSELGTDAMRYIRERVELPGDANRPSLDDVDVSALDYVESIIAGFNDMYRLLARYKAELLADDGPLNWFAQDEIRVLLRPTRTYSLLLFEAFHPDNLRDGLDRDLFIDRLWTIIPARPYLTGVVASEQADIRRGDIPLFTTRPASLDLYSTDGVPISGVLAVSGMTLVQRRLEQLGDIDRRRQEWLIRASLATLDLGSEHPPAYHLEDSRSGASQERILACARAAAEHLAATAILGEQDATWIGMGPQGAQEWVITPLGLDLYGGVTGIALFLAYAGALLHEDTYTTLARRALNTVTRHADLLRGELTDIGGFEGWGGLLYTLTHLGALWDDSSVLGQAWDIVDVIAGYTDRDASYDIARGSAGAIGSLLAYHRCVPAGSTLDIASHCGDHLVAAAQPMAHGVGWGIPRFGSQPLTGFAHGAAGVAWALLELASATGNTSYRTTALQALEFERSLYSADEENWPDLRPLEPARNDTEPASPRYMAAWCHGSTGIGLARMAALPHLDDSQLTDEVHAAVRTTLTRGFGQTHSLCHGDLGNLELLLQAERVLGDGSWRNQANDLAASVLDSIERDGWQCGGPAGVEMPTLMLGVAGIGYQLLRLAKPDQVPSVLLLAPPVAHRQRS